MTDKELLTLAAKAAGDEIQWDGVEACWYVDNAEWNNPEWNPLVSDGDALRLAVKLESLRQQLADADESLKAVERALKDVDYRGSYADGVMYLKQQLAAAEAAMQEVGNVKVQLAAAKFREESLINTAKVNREGLQEQLAATQAELAEVTRQKNRMWFELAAALEACAKKDVRFREIVKMANYLDVLSIAMHAHEALAIKPDASILRQHDEEFDRAVCKSV